MLLPTIRRRRGMPTDSFVMDRTVPENKKIYSKGNPDKLARQFRRFSTSPVLSQFLGDALCGLHEHCTIYPTQTWTCVYYGVPLRAVQGFRYNINEGRQNALVSFSCTDHDQLGCHSKRKSSGERMTCSGRSGAAGRFLHLNHQTSTPDERDRVPTIFNKSVSAQRQRLT